MSEAATTIELSTTGIDGDNFDVFSSLRGGAGGEEKLDTFIDDSTDVKDMPAPVDALSLASKSEINSPENRMSEERREIICQGVASVACANCVARDDCPILRMRNFASKNLQPAPERESYLSELLNDNDDGIVVAGYVNSSDSEVKTIRTEATEVSEDRADESNEQMVSQEQECKALTNETVEVLGADMDTEAVETGSSSKKVELHIVDAVSDAAHDYNKQSTPIVIETDPVVPIVEDTKKVNDDIADMAVSDIQASPQIEVKEPKLVEVMDTADSLSPVSPVEVPSRETLPHTTIADDTGNDDNSYRIVSEPEEKSALPAAEQEPPVQMPDASVNVPMENAKHETLTKEVVAVEAPMPAKKQPDQPAVMTSPIQDYVEYGEEPAVDHNSTQPVVVDMPVAHEVVEVVPMENAAIEPEAPTPVIPVETIVDEDELWTDPPQGGGQEVAVDQTVYETPTSPVEQLDDAVIEENFHVNDEEVWAEENVVFFVEQSSVADPEAPLTEAVTAGPLTEAMIMTGEEIDEPEAFVTDEVESIEPLDNLQVVSVPEITKDDHEPVEQFVVPVPPTTKSVPTVELKEAPAQVLEKDGLPREKPADVIMTTSGENNLWCDDEIKTAVMEIGDVRSDVELPPERLEEPVSDEELTESAELELDEPDELATDAASDEYNYSSEVSVADEDSLIIKNHPLLGLWMDDSRLNPEDSKTPTTGSASVVSWLTKLVGVVAVYVVYSGRENHLSLG
jgi:hypothetical protein